MSQPHTMNPPSQRASSWRDALELAEQRLEPVFIPCSHYCDDRGWSLMNLFAGAMSEQGQINFSVQYPNVVKAWHRHAHQTDFWCCFLGHIKVGVHREQDGRSWSFVIGEKRPGVVIIPPPLWHGAATIGNTQAGLCYYVTQAFNPEAPDEQRRPWNSIEGFSWEVEHR